MKPKILGLVVVGLLSLPMAADAKMVTWEMQGTINSVRGSVPNFGAAAVGDPYTVRWSFDTDATIVDTRSYPPGVRYRYDASSLVMSVKIGVSDPVVFTDVPWSSSLFFGSRIYLRDDSGDQLVDGQPADGITFSLEFEDYSAVGLIFRTTDLSVVNGPGLPENPYDSMQGFGVSTFQYLSGDTTWGLTGSEVFSVRRFVSEVPEPGTLALLGLGLTGLGLSRLRKAN